MNPLKTVQRSDDTKHGIVRTTKFEVHAINCSLNMNMEIYTQTVVCNITACPQRSTVLNIGCTKLCAIVACEFRTKV